MDYCTTAKEKPISSKIPLKTASKIPLKTAPKIGRNNRRTNVQDTANIPGGELYAKLKNHLKSYLEKIVEVRLLSRDFFIQKEVRDCNKHCTIQTLYYVTITSVR